MQSYPQTLNPFASGFGHAVLGFTPNPNPKPEARHPKTCDFIQQDVDHMEQEAGGLGPRADLSLQLQRPRAHDRIRHLDALHPPVRLGLRLGFR